jgi:hypothetical protein
MSSLVANTILTTTIEHSNGTDALLIDSAGRVFQPNRPLFYVDQSAGLSSSAVTIFTTQFNRVIHNVGGHYSTTTGRFTAPVAGTYFFHGKVLQRGPSSIEVSFYKNGVNVTTRSLGYCAGDGGTTTHHGDVTAAYYLVLAANDYVQFGCAASGNPATTDYYYGEGLAHFYGYLWG